MQRFSLFLFSFYPFSLKLSIHPVKVNRHSSSRLAKFILQKKPQDFPEAFANLLLFSAMILYFFQCDKKSNPHYFPTTI